MLKPTLEQAKQYTGYSVIPVCREMLSDIRTPIEVLRILRSVSHHVYILESVENQEKWGRYTFLGYNPKMELTCIDGELTVKNLLTGQTETTQQSHPADYIKKLLAGYSSPKIDGFPSFTGGLVGYFSYDYIKYSEPTLNLDAEDEEHFKDVDLMLFDKVIAFDNIHQKIMLITNISTDDIDGEYAKAERELAEMEQLIRHGKPADIPPAKLTSEFRRLFDKEQYCAMVEKAKRYIYEGDIFQVVLSNRLDADFEGSLFDAYRVLRATNPSPYMFFFSSDDMEIAGASPETLVKLENGVLHTFPLAGTRPRGATDEQDKQLEAELLKDEKELSEHNMLVDLGRNDIGKISKFGSVEVEKYMSIERYSHVMHIGSTVRGEILDSKCAFDAVDAILPAGTLSGAPKIRACEIINELENNKRGV
ncbi:MAG: anthranilate synthase component I family protein, partial [Oscillospiraceae bacterium]